MSGPDYYGEPCECNGGPDCACPDCDHLDCSYRLAEDQAADVDAFLHEHGGTDQ